MTEYVNKTVVEPNAGVTVPELRAGAVFVVETKGQEDVLVDVDKYPSYVL
jgi:hypothetical protein